MKVSKKSDYALRALVSLANNREKLFSIRQIASENNISKRFLEQIMLELKDNRIIEGIPGRLGGYRLLVSPSELTVGRIIRLFDGMLAPINCVSMKEYEKCSQENQRKFRRLFLNIRNFAANLLESYSIEDLRKLEVVNYEEIDKI